MKKILHINCNYLDSWLHQTMIKTSANICSRSTIFVPVLNRENHIVTPCNEVTVSECFNKLDRLFFDYKQRKIFRSLIKEISVEEYSCVHAYTVYTDGNIARKIYKKYGIPYIVAVRNTDVNVFFKYLLYLRRKGIKILEDASAVLFLSDSYKRQVIDKYIPDKFRQKILEKSLVIPNGIDNYWHNNLYYERNIERAIYMFSQKKLNILYVGNVDSNKNIKLTCEAINNLRCRGWEIQFTVVGKIINSTVYTHIKPYVTYIEPCSKEELIMIYRKNDIFIMVSHKETFGLVYAEAMSQGLPVIYTRHQGFDNQFENGVVGYSSSDSNVEELESNIIKCTLNYKELSNNAIINVNKFRWENICSKYIKLYDRI